MLVEYLRKQKGASAIESFAESVVLSDKMAWSMFDT